MPQTIHLARAAAFAIALIVPTISTVTTTAAYADNESADAIAAPYQTAGTDKTDAGNRSDGAVARHHQLAQNDTASCPPAASATGDVLGAGGAQDELARKMYQPGVSDR